MRDGVDGGYGFPLTIRTRRLALKLPNAAERASIAELASNPRVAGNLAAVPGERHGADCASFAIAESEGQAVIGAASYGAMADRQDSVEIAIWIGEPYWGRGYATEATQALIDHIFATDRIQQIWSSHRVISTRSRRVVEKCGFQYRGTGMVRSPVLNGAVPIERFVLDRRNWQSLKAWGALGARVEHDDTSRDHAA